MKQATVYSRCECQAQLVAELDENRHVLRGYAVDVYRKQRLPAPSQSLRAHAPRFDVAWFCPFCIRNVLRSFDAGGLAYRKVPEAQPTTTPPV
ncbi:MAG TPA: hypothetical protein VKZ49_16970 [Polyangiaceae bacterium]|nr:hypothetical protein [Polyangiaceae bacterium]